MQSDILPVMLTFHEQQHPKPASSDRNVDQHRKSA